MNSAKYFFVGWRSTRVLSCNRRIRRTTLVREKAVVTGRTQTTIRAKPICKNNKSEAPALPSVANQESIERPANNDPRAELGCTMFIAKAVDVRANLVHYPSRLLELLGFRAAKC
jgi:hypothetical protein